MRVLANISVLGRMMLWYSGNQKDVLLLIVPTSQPRTKSLVTRKWGVLLSPGEVSTSVIDGGEEVVQLHPVDP